MYDDFVSVIHDVCRCFGCSSSKI